MSPRRAATDPLARRADPEFAGATHVDGSMMISELELFKQEKLKTHGIPIPAFNRNYLRILPREL
jgi:hypothetical protein